MFNNHQKSKYISLTIFFGVLFTFYACGPSKGEVDQELTNKYSGEYKGKLPTGYVFVDYTIYVDPVKYVKKNKIKKRVMNFLVISQFRKKL